MKHLGNMPPPPAKPSKQVKKLKRLAKKKATLPSLAEIIRRPPPRKRLCRRVDLPVEIVERSPRAAALKSRGMTAIMTRLQEDGDGTQAQEYMNPDKYEHIREMCYSLEEQLRLCK